MLAAAASGVGEDGGDQVRGTGAPARAAGAGTGHERRDSSVARHVVLGDTITTGRPTRSC